MNKEKSSKRIMVKATEKALITLAEIFSSVACQGRAYEPKVPDSLKK